MQLREQLLNTVEVRNLEHMGFSHEQVTRLLRIKALFPQGAHHEVTPGYKRLEFIRWLYLQGRLQS
jgi:hypothetical protein